MNISLLSFLLSCPCLIGFVSGFAIVPKPALLKREFSLPLAADNTALTEAERLRAKVAQLRAQAAAAEQSIQGNMLEKKASRDQATDAMIEKLFLSNSEQLVDRLRTRRPSADTLLRVLERLDERQAQAEGKVFVEADGGREFHSTAAPPDPVQAAQCADKIDDLLAAAALLDQEYAAAAESSSAHVQHFGGGRCAQELTNRLQELRRERSDHYQKRVADLREASRLKDDDDHKFHGYQDMGTMN